MDAMTFMRLEKLGHSNASTSHTRATKAALVPVTCLPRQAAPRLSSRSAPSSIDWVQVSTCSFAFVLHRQVR